MANPTTNFGWVMPTTTSLVTNLPADFNTFGQGVDTSMAGLLGGTTGQILSKTSATNMAFTWINNDQGDITGVTAGTGISGGGTSGTVTVSIDTAVTVDKTTAQTLTNKTLTTPIISSISNTGTLTLPTSTDTLVGKATTDTLTNKTISATSNTLTGVINNTLTTTTGDIIYASAANTPARLGIGSTSQVLTVTGGVPVWAAAAGASAFSGCQLTNTSNPSISNSTETGLSFNTELFDTDSYHSTSSNTGRITIPSGKTGYYLLLGTAQWDANLTGRREFILKKNGTKVIESDTAPSASSYPTPMISWSVYAAAADYFEIYVVQTSGGALTIYDQKFGIVYLGA